MSLNPAAKRLVARYTKLSNEDKETFLERTSFNYKDSRFIHSLVEWSAEKNLPNFLETFLNDAHHVGDTDLIDYVVERIYRNRKILGSHGEALFATWVNHSSFDCEKMCLKNLETWDLKWNHNLIPHIENIETRYLAYAHVVEFCAPVSATSGFSNPENIIKPYYEGVKRCLILDNNGADILLRLGRAYSNSDFVARLIPDVEKQRLQLHVNNEQAAYSTRKL